jgi:hypothetical protein
MQLTLNTQVKSDAQIQTYIDTYIIPNGQRAITGAMMNTIMDYVNYNKIHKDSLDNVRILNDSTITWG